MAALPVELRRDEFLQRKWDYRPGQHVLEISPTGGGKTHLAYQLLGRAMEQNPHLTPVTLMPKLKDPSTVEWAERLNLREIPAWPPRKKLFAPKPDGYVLWPPHPMDLTPEQRHEVIGSELRRGIDALYKKGNSIAFLDDASSAAGLMGLNPWLEETLQNGRASGAGIWLATQQPKGSVSSQGITSYAYANSQHLFFGLDYTDSNLKRIGEVGGIDSKQVESWVRGLRTWRMGDSNVTEWLYLDKAGPWYCRILPW